jgi:hypothetical protein
MAKGEGLKEPPGRIDDLGVKRRVIITNSLVAKLMVLTVSSCLGSFVSENGGNIIQLYWLRQIMQPMF